jgi:hypothetical protein
LWSDIKRAWVFRASYDLEGVGNNADSHELLSVVAAVHHQRVGETLNDGAVGLAETLDGITTSRVRDVDGGSDLDVIAAKQPLASTFQE